MLVYLVQVQMLKHERAITTLRLVLDRRNSASDEEMLSLLESDSFRQLYKLADVRTICTDCFGVPVALRDDKGPHADILRSLWSGPGRMVLAKCRIHTNKYPHMRFALMGRPRRMAGKTVTHVHFDLVTIDIIQHLGDNEFLSIFHVYDQASELPLLLNLEDPSKAKDCTTFSFQWVLLTQNQKCRQSSPLTRVCQDPEIKDYLGPVISAIKGRFKHNKVSSGPFCYKVSQDGCAARGCILTGSSEFRCGCADDTHLFCSESCRTPGLQQHREIVRQGMLTDQQTKALFHSLDSMDFLDTKILKLGLCLPAPTNIVPEEDVERKDPVEELVEVEECSICLDETGYIERAHSCTPNCPMHGAECCLHAFHRTCLDTWEKTCVKNGQLANCPICRRVL